MLQTGGLHWAFSYEELVYRDNKLEALSTFELDQALVEFSRAGFI